MSQERTIGNVNWFDSKKGFGFITVVTPDNEHTGKDVFVHFSNIDVKNDNYKRLYPGEYVEFVVKETSDERGPGCFEVTGLYGGKLLTDNEDHRYKIYPKNRQGQSVTNDDDADDADDADDVDDA